MERKKNMEEPARSLSTKLNFIAYLEAHPEQRFWQAVRNFTESDFVLVGHYPKDVQQSMELWVDLEDTFYREEK